MSHQSQNISRDGLRTVAQGLDKFLTRIDAGGIAQKNIFVLTMLLAVLAIITARPDYGHFHFGGGPLGNAVMQWKFDHPLQPVPVKEMAAQMHENYFGLISHLEKTSYRIFVPLVAHTLGFSPTAALVLQQILACFFLLLTLSVAREILRDNLSALLAAMMVAVSFPGQWGFDDFLFFDGYAYFLIALAVWTTSPLVLAAAVLAGGLTDERVIIAAPLIYLWISVRHGMKSSDLSAKNILRPRAGHIGLMAGVILFGGVRLLLAHKWGAFYEASLVCQWDIAKNNTLFLPAAILTGLKGGIVIIGLALALLLASCRYFLLSLACLCVIPSLLATIMVGDLTRSLFYAFPAIFIALAVIAHQCGTNDARRRVTFYALLGSALFPTCWVAPCNIYLLMRHY